MILLLISALILHIEIALIFSSFISFQTFASGLIIGAIIGIIIFRCLLYFFEKAECGEEKDINTYEELVGGKFFFRTVTYHTVGEVVKIIGRFVQLKDASWVADSGRFMNAIKDGTLDEVEPVGEAFVNLDTVVDIFPWTHPLPTEQK